MAERINLNKHKKDFEKLNEEITNIFGNVNDTENIMVLSSDETDWVDIFGAVLDFDVLNDAIHSFETEFKNQRPYLVMSNLTLKVFEELSEPITRNEEDVVCVEHNCEKSTIYGCYEGYTIVVDNNLGFGVVKVR